MTEKATGQKIIFSSSRELDPIKVPTVAVGSEAAYVGVLVTALIMPYVLLTAHI